MKKRLNTYLAISITTFCNYQCFYCKEGGESISKHRETIEFSKLKQIITNAYDGGIKNFRITGGEPTAVSYFGEMVEFIMKMSGTKMRINTNGYQLLKYIDVLTKYRERIDIVFSVDSMSEYIQDVHFQKFLSKEVIITTKILKAKKISVRYNIVVTKLNEDEVRPLIMKAVDELKVNVKLLDLNKFPEYLGYGNKICEQEALNFWKKLFVQMNRFYDFLNEISTSSNSEWTTGLISKGHGIPMSSYFRGENWIQVKDSERGAKYAEYCKTKCPYFKNKDCQEGVFSLFLSSNLVLHLSGCKNRKLQFNLNLAEDEQIKSAFENLLKFI